MQIFRLGRRKMQSSSIQVKISSVEISRLGAEAAAVATVDARWYSHYARRRSTLAPSASTRCLNAVLLAVDTQNDNKYQFLQLLTKKLMFFFMMLCSSVCFSVVLKVPWGQIISRAKRAKISSFCPSFLAFLGKNVLFQYYSIVTKLNYICLLICYFILLYSKSYVNSC
jgi:hypothetical protein